MAGQNGGGSPPHIPTSYTRKKVVNLSCAGFNQGLIAKYLGVNVNTLRKHYRRELDDALMDKTVVLANMLYKDALNGCQRSREFWLKCRGGWSYAKATEEDKSSKTESLLEKLNAKNNINPM